MVARDEQKRMAGRVAWGDMVDGAVADMVAWDDALGVMMWVTATSRRKEGLTGTDWRRKGQAGDHRTANKRGAGASGRCRHRQGRCRKERASGQKGRRRKRQQAQAQAAGGWRELAGASGARSGRTRKEAD